MDHPLHDRELDAFPPTARSEPQTNPDAWNAVVNDGTSVKGKIRTTLRPDSFVVWFGKLSMPNVVAFGLSMGGLVSTPLMIAVRSDHTGFALLMGLYAIATLLFAVQNRQIALPQIAIKRRSPQPPKPKGIPPRKATKDHIPQTPKRPCSQGVLELMTSTDPRFVYLTASIRRKVIWCFSVPFAMCTVMAVSFYLPIGLVSIPFFLQARYGPLEPGSVEALLLGFVILLDIAVLFVVWVSVVLTNGIGFGLYFYGGILWAVIGPTAAVYSIMKSGWSGWDYPISIVFNPLVQLSLLARDCASKGLNHGYRIAWKLIGWQPSGSTKPVPKLEIGKEPEASSLIDDFPDAKSRLLPKLSDFARGRVLALLTVLVFATVSNTVALLPFWFRWVFPLKLGRPNGGLFRGLELFALGCLFAGLSYALIRFLLEVRGTGTKRNISPTALDGRTKTS